MKPFVGVLLLVAVLGATAATADAQSTPAAPTVGSTIKTKQVAVTLRAYRELSTVTAAIDVKVCNRTTSSQPIRRTQLFLELPDHPLVLPDETVATPRPQLQTAPLAGKRCVRGWVSYQVPAGARATRVVFQAGAMFTATLHTWDVPTG